MKVNKIISLSFATIVLLFASCKEDFINQNPTSVVTELTYYKTVSELNNGLTACYGAMRTIGGLTGFEQVHWQIGDIGSDDAEKGGENETDNPALGDISLSRQNASNTTLTTVWSAYYQVIARCNEVIDRSAGTLGDATAIEKIVDQAKFIRALCYYQLVTTFGEIPLVTTFLIPSQLDMEKSPVSALWTQIESDLKDASNLPTKSQWNESGRISSGAVFMLLGKVNLTQKKYQQANSAFHRVVASGEYQLVPDFGFVFRHDGENCAESIFEIQHKTNISGGNMGTFSGILRISRDADAGGWGFDCPTNDLLNEFEKGDPRVIYTFLFPGDVLPTLTGKYTVTNTKSPTTFHARKAWIPWSERAGLFFGDFDINYRYMRYAEVLLLYAESLNEVNKADSAMMLTNMVRARARNSSATDPQRISCVYNLTYTGELLPDVKTSNQADLRKAIWHEQRVELAIEGHRRNMLLRTGQFKTRMEAAKGAKGCKVEDHEWLLPIPQTEIELSNKKLTQNTGY